MNNNNKNSKCLVIDGSRLRREKESQTLSMTLSSCYRLNEYNQKLNVNFIINYKNNFHIWTEYNKHKYYDANNDIYHALIAYW